MSDRVRVAIVGLGMAHKPHPAELYGFERRPPLPYLTTLGSQRDRAGM